ncbi:MAG: SUMF1/EgtB/PvdO family nonheme iron enzyme, partial [Spirochaetales bacterium]|nr:SUMF1/EgtB/PvdO family nonheme iron enzyme [Spirochaetales bacterium]
NNQAGIIFPTVYEPTGLDTATATLTAEFWIGETELTNAVAAAVFQWAWKNEKFSATVSDPNGLDSTRAKHGGQILLDMADDACRVHYNDLTGFSADSGYENNPLTNVTWYGAVMLCNWLTEMRDGGTANVVYTNIDTSWNHEETLEDTVETGYRLPSHEEWEYAARYLGTTAPTVGNLASQYIARNHNAGAATLTEGYCWTPGVYAAGATDDYYNAEACRAVAVYYGQDPAPTDEAAVKSLGAGSASVLGLYDMSGNVGEWCFTILEAYPSEISRIFCGGSYDSDSEGLVVGIFDYDDPDNDRDYQGLRLCRTTE